MKRPAQGRGNPLVLLELPMVIDRLLALAGWERPWDSAEIMDL